MSRHRRRVPPGERPSRTPPAAREPSRRTPTGALAGSWPYLAAFAAAVAVFGPTLRYELLNWDDTVYVVQNPWIRALTWRNVEFLFTHPYFSNYLPLHLLSYALDYRLWGLTPFGFHLSSVLLHGVNAALSVLVVRRLTGSMPIAILAGILFAVHPSHVESVAWVSSRKDLLSMAFLLLSLAAYGRARTGGGLSPVPYAISVGFFAMGLLSKVSAVVLPAFLLLLDFMPERRESRVRPMRWTAALASKIPYGLLGIALVVVNNQAQVKAAAPYAHEPLRYLMVKGHAVWNYLGLLAGLRSGSPDYDLPRMGTGPLDAARELGGLAILPAAAFLLWKRKRRVESLGVSWIFLMLLPAVLFPLVTYMADRYLYAPSLGFCWVAAALVVQVGGLERPRRSRSRTAGALAAAGLVLAAFTARTLQYSGVWRSSDTLWTYAVTKSRDYRVYNNLADVRMRQKRWGEAERLLKQGAQHENVTSYQSLGVLYYDLRRYDEALSATDRALAIQAKRTPDPANEAELRFNRGAILWLQGKVNLATGEWERALRLDPGHVQAREWLRTARGGGEAGR